MQVMRLTFVLSASLKIGKVTNLFVWMQFILIRF